MGPVNGWHKGERAIQHKMGYAGVMAQAWTWIDPEMPEDHQVFYTTRLPFIPVTTIDDKQRPWSSILAGKDGHPGFATSQHPGELKLNAHVWEGDPFPQNIAPVLRGRPVLIAGIGVEFSTRRRNKFAGHIETLENDGPVFRVRSVVNEAIGNCPKYINVRDLVPFSETHPRVVYQCLTLSLDERLPDDIISFIHGSDTLFLGTYYDAREHGEQFPSHVGMNQRGGRPGFARIRPSDGRTLVIPDYSGNRLLTSLGNIEATPVAGVTFVSFVTGAILYLTGDAHNLVGPAAPRLMPRINALTTIHVTGYIFVEDALPVRQKTGTKVQRSPYSPPIRLLAEEIASTYSIDDLRETTMVTLARIEAHSHDIATFTFESPTPVDIVPGQAAILDFKSFVGALPYQHMAPENPMSVNDDRMRTWTVSGSSRWASSFSGKLGADAGAGPVLFTLTIRHMPGGVVTSSLFTIVYQMGKFRPELLEDARPLQFTVPLIGVAGDFTLPMEADVCTSRYGEGPSSSPRAGTRKWLWLAGGIGVTPFLAMLAHLRDKKSRAGGDADDIILVLSTREPDVLLALVIRALERNHGNFQELAGYRGTLSIHVFSRSPASSSSLVGIVSGTVLSVEVTRHAGRLNKDTLRALSIEDVQERQAYVCGPEGFEQVVLGALKEVGVDSHRVRREEFTY